MKKSLLAVAAMTAFAGAAQAQSSVTVYGILDVGYIGGNSSQTIANTQTKATGNAFSDGAESTSRLGFKGTEDLGGGTSAFFTVEVALTPNSAQTLSSGSTSNRQTFAGLKKNGLGDFSFGTQYTPVHNAVAATDAGQANNMVGDAVYGMNSRVPGAQGGSSQISSSGNDNNSAYTVRVNNSLMLNSDTFAGFKAHAMLVANNTNSNQTTTVTGTTTAVTGGMNNQNGWGLGLDYTWNKLFATANYQAFTSKNAYTLNSATGTYSAGTPAIWGLGGASSPATPGANIQDNQAYVAATYDFGILKAYAQWVSRKAYAQQESNYYVKRQAEQIGVRSFITPTIEGWASAGLGRYTSYGVNAPTANFNAWQLGANYWLSKRTNLYAIFGAENTSTYSVPAGGVGGLAAGTYNTNNNGYALGMRHTF